MLVRFFSVERLTVGNADDRTPADGPYQAVYYSLTTGARMQGENCLGFSRRILSSRRQSARSLAELLIDDCFFVFLARVQMRYVDGPDGWAWIPWRVAHSREDPEPEPAPAPAPEPEPEPEVPFYDDELPSYNDIFSPSGKFWFQHPCLSS